MMALYDQEQVFKSFLESLKYDSIAEGIAEGEARGKLDSNIAAIKNIMESLGFTVMQAMNVLKIPEDERGKYLSALQLS